RLRERERRGALQVTELDEVLRRLGELLVHAVGAERQLEIELWQQAVLGDLGLDRRAGLLLGELGELGTGRVGALEQWCERPAHVARLELTIDAKREVAWRDL